MDAIKIERERWT